MVPTPFERDSVQGMESPPRRMSLPYQINTNMCSPQAGHENRRSLLRNSPGGGIYSTYDNQSMPDLFATLRDLEEPVSGLRSDFLHTRAKFAPLRKRVSDMEDRFDDLWSKIRRQVSVRIIAKNKHFRAEAKLRANDLDTRIDDFRDRIDDFVHELESQKSPKKVAIYESNNGLNYSSDDAVMDSESDGSFARALRKDQQQASEMPLVKGRLHEYLSSNHSAANHNVSPTEKSPLHKSNVTPGKKTQEKEPHSNSAKSELECTIEALRKEPETGSTEDSVDAVRPGLPMDNLDRAIERFQLEQQEAKSASSSNSLYGGSCNSGNTTETPISQTEIEEPASEPPQIVPSPRRKMMLSQQKFLSNPNLEPDLFDEETDESPVSVAALNRLQVGSGAPFPPTLEGPPMLFDIM